MIPLATTTITIRRPRAGEDPYDATDPQIVARGIRAQVGSPSGADRHRGGDQQIVSKALRADPCDLRHYDLVTDDLAERRYEVVWVDQRHGLGLDHTAAGLRLVEGAANG